MEIVNMREHAGCPYCGHPEKPVIEVMSFGKGEKVTVDIQDHEVVFFIKGKISYIFRDYPRLEGSRGQIIFYPSHGEIRFEVLEECTVLILRLLGPVRLCENFVLEWLYGIKNINPAHNRISKFRNMGNLKINAPMRRFAENVCDRLSDGLRCKYYCDLKIQEFLLLLRTYYSREQLHDFLYMILSGQTVFSEQIKYNFRQNSSLTVRELADSMNLPQKEFSKQFKDAFGTTVNRWMQEGRAKIILYELATTEKPIKEIAYENRFASASQFTHFCRKELGNTPSGIRNRKKGKEEKLSTEKPDMTTPT